MVVMTNSESRKAVKTRVGNKIVNYDWSKN